MNLIKVFLLFFVFSINEVSVLRNTYLKAVNNETSAKELNKITLKKSDYLNKCYHGVSYCLMAKFAWNPYTKLNYVNKGLEIINSSINLNSKDVETRFLRFSIEENLPSVVSFTSHKLEDKNYIINNIDKKHPFYSTISGYMKKSNFLTNEEKKKFE